MAYGSQLAAPIPSPAPESTRGNFGDGKAFSFDSFYDDDSYHQFWMAHTGGSGAVTAQNPGNYRGNLTHDIRTCPREESNLRHTV